MSSLWDYSRDSNPAALRPAEWEHLKTCEDCVFVLWACVAADSYDQLQEKLKEFGLKASEANA